MKKAFDQTVRDLKREVNKKVLKVPSIEQKILDVTSNEAWGPHGSLLADIAQATRNYHEYQMIMSVIWKRINDTGKNWRHVYKALVVLDYLVANGSERVIDDIREHAYQIFTLSDFQYIDSSGRDQGNNVRKKSQSLVALVNDKERIQEARQKAAANRDKFRSNHTDRSGSGYGDRYDDGRYEGRYRDDERNGNGKERDWGSRDDDRYGRYGDSYNRDGDRYNRDAEDRYRRESYQDDNYRGRSQSVDDYHHGSRGRSADSYRNAIEDDGQYSSRASGVKADDHPQARSSIDKKLDRKYSGKSMDAPPSYEDAVSSARSPSYSERDGESSLPPLHKAFGADSSHGVDSTTPPTIPVYAVGNASSPAPTPESPPMPTNPAAQPGQNEVDVEEFDPRSLLSAAPAPSNGASTAVSGVEMDLLGSLDLYSASSLALVPAGQPSAPDANIPTNLTSETSVSTLQSSPAFDDKSFDDPFGDGPFKAVPSTGSMPAQQHMSVSPVTFNASSNGGQDAPPIPQGSPVENAGQSFDATYMPPGPSAMMVPSSTHLVQQELTSPSLEVDILADILPPAPVPAEMQASYPIAPTQSLSHNGFSPEDNQPLPQPAPVMHQNAPQNGFQIQSNGGFPAQLGQPSMQTSHALMSAQLLPNTGFANQAMGYTYPVQTGNYSQMAFLSQGVVPQTPQMGFPQAGSVQPGLTNPNIYGAYNSHPLSTGQTGAYAAPPTSTGISFQNNFLSQTGSTVPVASQMGQQAPRSQTGSITSPASISSSLMGSTGVSTQPSEDKFETKSSVWADTLSRGLVNLNISGPKASPYSDIGVDFDAINRKEKRMEKPTTTSITSTVTMGKAMGAGSGIGRAGAGSVVSPPNPMVGSAMNMGMGGYGVNQPFGRGMSINSNMSMPGNMGVGMNMGMGPGMNMQQPHSFPPGTAIPGGGYNIGGAGNYAQAPPPYGGYR